MDWVNISPIWDLTQKTESRKPSKFFRRKDMKLLILEKASSLGVSPEEIKPQRRGQEYWVLSEFEPLYRGWIEQKREKRNDIKYKYKIESEKEVEVEQKQKDIEDKKDFILSVVSHQNILVIDSRLIAKELNIEHRTLIETAEAHKTKLEAAFGILRVHAADVLGRGQPEKFMWLTEDQATVLMTFSRNTPEVVNFKIALVKSFSDAKQKIKNREENYSEWKAIKACVLPEPKKWKQQFSPEFWTKLELVTGKAQCVCAWLTQWIYTRLPRGVHKAITTKNPRDGNGNRRHKTHQFLTPDIGISALELYKAQFIAVMDVSPIGNYPLFLKNIKKVFSHTLQLELPLLDDLENLDEAALEREYSDSRFV